VNSKKFFAEKIKSVMYMDNGVVFVTFEDKCVQYHLSRQEREVLQLILEGKQIKGISKGLGVSIHTVRNHTQRIYKKYGVSNRVELLNVFRG
jgi:DNA-binding CsgD family transcriptional regulator